MEHYEDKYEKYFKKAVFNLDLKIREVFAK